MTIILACDLMSRLVTWLSRKTDWLQAAGKSKSCENERSKCGVKKVSVWGKTVTIVCFNHIVCEIFSRNQRNIYTLYEWGNSQIAILLFKSFTILAA